jgi:hypothetical protein
MGRLRVHEAQDPVDFDVCFVDGPPVACGKPAARPAALVDPVEVTSRLSDGLVPSPLERIWHAGSRSARQSIGPGTPVVVGPADAVPELVRRALSALDRLVAAGGEVAADAGADLAARRGARRADTGGCLVRYTGGTGSHDVNRMLFSRPDSPMRWNMTVSVSYDEGYSLRYSRIVNPNRSYYSDLARLSDRTVILLYGCDGDIASSPRRVAVARFNLEWLTQGRDSLATGPRLTERTHDLGYPALGALRSGGTVSVVREPTARGGARAAFAPDAVGDFIEYRFVAGRDHEYELWLRYYRPVACGVVTITVDGQAPQNSTIDTSAEISDGYDVVLLGRMRLRPSPHTIRFTLAAPGRRGGTAISVDELSLVESPAAADVREEITVDNGEFGYQVVAGTWPSGTGVAGYYGSNYASHGAGVGNSAVRWRPALTGDDRYDVLVSCSAASNRATNATYTVNHADGSTPVAVNQKVQGVPENRGGEWVSLGVFPFRGGIDGNVGSRPTRPRSRSDISDSPTRATSATCGSRHGRRPAPRRGPASATPACTSGRRRRPGSTRAAPTKGCCTRCSRSARHHQQG